jgi:hypothetical protein
MWITLHARRFNQGKTVKATERDEVKSFRPLDPLQAARHGSIRSGDPLNPTHSDLGYGEVESRQHFPHPHCPIKTAAG